MKRKTIAVLLSATMILSMAACSNSQETTSGSESEEKTETEEETTDAEETSDGEGTSGSEWDFSGVKAEIDVDSYVGDDVLTLFEDRVAEFNELTGAELELVANGTDHESIMKTRMASNDMPDMFTTHGWSTVRYNEFSYDLSGESWVADLSAPDIVTDANGKVCACPLTQAVYGMVYNETIMEENGIDMYSTNTWNDLIDALQKIKDAGITPIACAGKEGGQLGGYVQISSVFYTAEGAPYDGGEELKDGTFSFVDHPEVYEQLAELYDNGFFNEDLFTTDYDTARKYVAAGDAAMMLWCSATDFAGTMKELNPDSEFGVCPLPAADESGNRVFEAGEAIAVAISKDTENLELCKAFLEFMTETENLQELIDTTSGSVSGFTTTTAGDSYSLGKYSEAVENIENLIHTPIFDRNYMPSGTWSYMGESTAELFNSEVGAAKDKVASVAEYMQQAYEELYATAAEQ